jgi:myo-inositol-1(or 4)-monophosphatase
LSNKQIPDQNFWSQVLHCAQSITEQVGQQLLADFGKVQASQKADGSLVTQADQWADHYLREQITAVFPDHGLLTEENEQVFPNKDWCWVVDPLDGTTNFTRGIPIWGISLGLLYQGTPVFGYVHMPPLSQSFYGFWNAPGDCPQGAFLNNQAIHASADEITANHFFSFCARSLHLWQPGFPCKARLLGSAAYNFLMVATGATLGGVEATPKIWDIAGAWVIVQAAGGVWLSLEAKPIFPLVAGVDYGKRDYPTLVASRSDLIPKFQPFVEALNRAPLTEATVYTQV